MKRIALALALLIAGLNPAMAAPLVRLHCADPDGIIMANWRVQDGRYRLKISGERKWSTVPEGAVAPMILMLWSEGVKCVRR